MNDMSTTRISTQTFRLHHSIAATSLSRESLARLQPEIHDDRGISARSFGVKIVPPKNLKPVEREAGERCKAAFSSAALVKPGEGFAIREELLWQILTDQAESLNRLYNIVGQAGLDIVFYDEKGNLVGHYGALTGSEHRSEPLAALSRATGQTEKNNAAARAERGTVKTVEYCPTQPAADRGPGCLATPVFGGDAGLIGFLDVLPRNSNVSREASGLAATLLYSTARAIEERAFRKLHRREWIVALLSRGDIGRGFLLALDGRQRVVAMDRHTQSMFSAGETHFESGVSLWTIFERDPALFRNADMGDIPASLVSVGTSEMWSALITPPESAAIVRGNPAQAILHSRPRLDSIGYFCQSGPPTPSIGGLTPRALQRVREYVDAHLCENVELEALANLVGLSRCYFARAFKQSVGMPPHCYVMKRRLERAQDLLAQTDLSLAQIALESGFSDQSHFSRRFRLFVGVTPRSFRWARR